jgi:hypothetical protein
VLSHFPTIVIGEGLAQVCGQVLEGADECAGDADRVFGAAKRHDHHVAGDPFGDDQNGGAIARAHNQVGLPVSGHFPVLHLGGSFADIDRSGQLAGELGASTRGGTAARFALA